MVHSAFLEEKVLTWGLFNFKMKVVLITKIILLINN